MVEQGPDSQQVLCAEILAEARRQREHIVQAARQQAEALLARTTQAAEDVRQQKLEAARTAAARRREQILAAVPLDAKRLRSAAIESELQSIFEHAQRELQGVRVAARETPVETVRETLVSLAAEAIRQMVADAFVIKLSPADHAALAEGLEREIARRLGDGASLTITISADPSLDQAGVVIEDHESRQVWDNRLPARLKRMWPELRQQIALGASRMADCGSAGTSP